MKESNTCTRVLADVNQIRECREDILVVDQSVKDLAGALGLAGNEVRLKVLFLLHKEKEMCPCDLSDVLQMKVPAISQHLRKMKDGGIIRDRKVGQTIFYSLVEAKTQILQPILDQLIEDRQKVTVK